MVFLDGEAIVWVGTIHFSVGLAKKNFRVRDKLGRVG